MGPEPIREFYFESRGEQIRVCISPGSDDQIPLLICSGFGVSFEVLDSVAEALQKSTVIRFDAPGIGGGFKKFPFYRFTRLAGILDDLLEHLEYDQVDIYGISWGGMLAQEFALKYPDRCRKLILASTLTGQISVPGNILAHVLFSPTKWLLGKTYSRFASLVYGGKVLKRQWMDLENHLMLFHANLPGYLGQISASIGWTSIHRLRRLSQPVLLLFGNDDSVIPLINATILNKTIPDARLIVFDCGHLFPWTCSHQVQREISRFRSE